MTYVLIGLLMLWASWNSHQTIKIVRERWALRMLVQQQLADVEAQIIVMRREDRRPWL